MASLMTLLSLMMATGMVAGLGLAGAIKTVTVSAGVTATTATGMVAQTPPVMASVGATETTRAVEALADDHQS
jgi:hypothetical protein